MRDDQAFLDAGCGGFLRQNPQGGLRLAVPVDQGLERQRPLVRSRGGDDSFAYRAGPARVKSSRSPLAAAGLQESRFHVGRGFGAAGLEARSLAVGERRCEPCSFGGGSDPPGAAPGLYPASEGVKSASISPNICRSSNRS